MTSSSQPRYHINPQTGEPGLCRAQPGNCPFASEEQHYQSMGEARAGYEKAMRASAENEVARVFVKNVNRRARRAFERALVETMDELRRERPVDFPEWEGDQASSQTVMNMGLRIMADQVQEALDRGSDTPYTDALDRLGELTQGGELNFAQASGLNLDQAHQYLTQLVDSNTRDRQTRQVEA